VALAALNTMNEQLFSPDWYRVAELKPHLRGHAVIHRHVYRGQVWFVLQDRASARVHRFTPQAHGIIGLMDGERTVQTIWEAAGDVFGDDAPTQGQVIELLGRLHQADLLQTQARPDADETQRRHDTARRSRTGQRYRNPLALRIPLFDPDRALDRLQPLARLLFNPAAAIGWLALVLVGLAVAGANAGALLAHASANALSGENLLLMVLVFPLVKLLHELGHALAVKRWGGQVSEVGVMLLVLAPLPYVDASGAAAFADKHRRIAVSAAGIAVELALAAIAVMLWVKLQPGLLRDLAFDVMLIGSVSTVLFNGNPLLRFDGYYVLADLIEIPNLAQRARRYLGYLVLRHAFGVASASSPVTAPGEAPWLLFYGIFAAVYRVLVAVTIISFVAGRFFIVGVVLAVFAALQMLVVPLIKQLVFLLRNPLLDRRRTWAVGLSTGVAVTLAAIVMLGTTCHHGGRRGVAARERQGAQRCPGLRACGEGDGRCEGSRGTGALRARRSPARCADGGAGSTHQ
jgi:putative peptide zinc metalloprotease protein